MAGLESRDRITNPRQSKIHVVKPGNGLPNYSYYTLYEDLLNVIKQDHPIVIGVYNTFGDLPTVNVNLGTTALVRDEKRLYVYDNDGWKPGSNGASETLTPENTVVYQPAEIYTAGNVFVSFVNETSADPLFQEAAIYRSRVDTPAGVSPEDSLYNPDTNPTGKWEYQGKTVTVSSYNTTASVVPSLADLRSIEGMKTSDTVIVHDIGYYYRFDSAEETGEKPNDNSQGSWVKRGRFNKSGLIDIVDAAKVGSDFFLQNIDDTLIVLVPGQIGIEDGTQTVFYLDITEPSFVVKTGIGFTEEDYKVLPLSPGVLKTYSIDFGSNSYVASEINMLGDIIITNVAASNVDSILLSYSGGIQQPVSLGAVNISVPASDVLTWEITRQAADMPAVLGVKFEII